MEKVRKPFQGVWNIIRFNWPYYVLAALSAAGLLLLRLNFNTAVRGASDILVILIIGSTLISLVVSSYVYDFSNLYNLSWLDKLPVKNSGKIVNINAGFDETSELLKSRFASSELVVFDFYDPARHTEVSIKRARKAYPAFPNTQQINPARLPLQDNSASMIFAILSAHEIRNDIERNCFFKELRRVLLPTGKIIVTEHLRDAANFLAYNIGAFHFHSKASWLRAFKASGLQVSEEIKITPFITTFILYKNGATP